MKLTVPKKMSLLVCCGWLAGVVLLSEESDLVGPFGRPGIRGGFLKLLGTEEKTFFLFFFLTKEVQKH